MRFLFFAGLLRIEALCDRAYWRRLRTSEGVMLDILFIAIGLGFLAGAMLYAVACERM
jgi:hypothetical protein